MKLSLPVLGTTPQCPFEATLPVCSSSRQCSVKQHCQFFAQAGTVALTNTTGSWLKLAVFSYPSLLV